MFTGLVRQTQILKEYERHDGGVRISVCLDAAQEMDIGASVCCSGCCLSVTGKAGDVVSFDVSNETLEKTTLSDWKEGLEINIEPSLKLGDELGGHFVFGHVDGLAMIRNMKEDGNSVRLTLEPPQNLMKFIASKGSVALDGISLTVNEVENDCFGVNIIPHTWEHTTLKHRKSGDFLNIEVDMLARYVERMIGQRT